MLKPAIPHNETKRIEALYKYTILDTLPQTDFDDITKLAAQICGTPISTITLIDSSRQWFKSAYGLNASESPRDFAFCAHAINEPNQLFIVPDSLQDERFADNPLVTGEPNVVFYAGVPLVNPDGYAVGTICVIDNKPGKISEEQKDALRVMSKQVVQLLELRKKNIELDERQVVLERTLKLLRQTSKVAKVGGWEIDLEKDKVAWTYVTKEIHEVPPEFAPDMQTFINFYKPGESRDTIAQLIKTAIEKEDVFDVELLITTAKGNDRWVRVKGESEFTNGKCVRVYGVFQDIHKEKVIDIQLARSEEQFRKTFNYAPIGMAIVAPDGKWINVNKSICEIVGYSEEELLQLTFQDITHPEDLEHDLEELKALLAGKITSYQIEKRYYHKNGAIVWVILSVSMVKDEGGKPIHFLSQIMDITARKAAEQMVKEERKLLRTLVDNIPVKIQIKDLQSNTILDNHKNEDYEPVVNNFGKNGSALNHSNSAVKDDAEVLSSGQAIINHEILQVRQDGKEAWFLNSKIPLKDDRDKITGLLKIGYDISERKEYEKQLNELVEVTNEQNARLLNFAHIVSHNLGSHSTNFAMLLYFLETETNEATKQEMFNLLKKASNNLTDTVANLNEVVAATTNTHKESRSINLKAAIQNVQDTIKAQLLESNVDIANEVTETYNIKGVPAYIDSVLLNFLTNGIKYRSPDKMPFVHLSAKKEDHYIVLTVKDNGLGIDLDKFGNNLFGMNKTFHGNKDARGVGLFITKNQVEAMGGKIKVESKVGEGTIFKVYFIAN